MKPETPTGAQPRFCPDCGDRVWSWGSHAERCYGPRAHGRCDCPPGWMHLPTCHHVTGEDAA